MKKELFELYVAATRLAMKNGQTVGEKNNYYITLEQLQAIVESLV